MDASIAIIFNSGRTQVLLVQRQDVSVWVLPGGGIDPGESPEETAIRETLEETGCKVEIIRKAAEYTPINRLARLTHTFECSVVGGKLQTSSESREVRFFDINKLPETLFFIHKEWIEDAVQNRHELIKKPLSQVTYRALFYYFCRNPWHVLRFFYTRLFS